MIFLNDLQSGDLIVIRSKTRTRIEWGFEVPVGWTAKFLDYHGLESIQVEMLGNWFPNDPEIDRCELIFNLNKVNITKVG
jgi:hypothetical protein